MNFAEIIRRIKEDNGLSQKETGELLGVNQTTVGQWLKDKKKPNFYNILTICEITQLTPNELLGFDEIGEERDFKLTR